MGSMVTFESIWRQTPVRTKVRLKSFPTHPKRLLRRKRWLEVNFVSRGKVHNFLSSRKIRETREGWNRRFQKNTPHGRWGRRSRQCRPKVPGAFAFPGARNPRICSILRFGKIFPAIFPGLSRMGSHSKVTGE